MHQLIISGIECYSFHGCLEEEAVIGNRYSVDLELHLDLTSAVESDKLEDTADYVFLHELVRAEMKIRSRLIEHVAGRIAKKLRTAFPGAAFLKVSLTKFNPPVNGIAGNATFIITA